MIGRCIMEYRESNQRKYMAEMLKQHEEFIIIGLTGRVGSGCSEAADIFASRFEALELPHVSVGTDDLAAGETKEDGIASDEKRDKRILLRYAQHHWLRFDVIRVRTVITSFLLNHMDDFCKEAAPRLSGKEEDEFAQEFQQALVARTGELLRQKSPEYSRLKEKANLTQKVIEQTGEKTAEEKFRSWDEYWQEFSAPLNSGRMETLENNGEVLGKLESLFKYLYDVANQPEYYQERAIILSAVDDFLDMISTWVAAMYWEKKMATCQNGQYTEVLEEIGTILWKGKESADADKLTFYHYVLIHDIIPALGDAIHELIAQKDSSLFTQLFQKYGNSIRRYGDVSFSEGTDIAKGQAERIGDNAFAIPRRINQFIKSIRHPFSRSYARPTRIVIDSIKSVLESTYLRERYSAFYLFAISADDAVREHRLINGVKKKLNMREIRFIDWNEYSNHGAKIYERYRKNKEKEKDNGKDNDKGKNSDQGLLDDDEFTFAEIVDGVSDGAAHVMDQVRKEAYRKNIQQFVLQDVGTAIQNADVFISNNHIAQTKNMNLRWAIVRNVSLIMYPGLLQPTAIERCMQAAFVAKVNSGCLSRQVGAVVTDSEYNILSIGWNDVPDCDISCSRKNLMDIHKERDLAAYSKYEIEDKDFRRRIKCIFEQNGGQDRKGLGNLLCGLPWRYCFKDVHLDEKQTMRSRAMHGEEKAMAKVPEKVPGGCLFTTSSPCEMCSKNAKNHHIKKIYYIEQYPGISADHYSQSGYTCNRAEHILFTGAIGRAYTQMYTPIIPHKDVLEFMGVNYKQPVKPV